MGDWRRSSVLHLPLGIQEADPVNNRTIDISGNKLHATLGAGAAAPTKLPVHGYSFSGNDYMTGQLNGAYNQAAISFCMLFAPSFAPNDGVEHYFYDSTVAAEYMIDKDAVNSLIFYCGVNVLSVALANYQNYWKLNQYNTIVFAGKSGDNQAILNQTSIGTSATAWNPVNPVNYWVGCRYDTTLFFSGSIFQFEVFPIRLTKIQADDWAIRAMQRVNSL